MPLMLTRRPGGPGIFVEVPSYGTIVIELASASILPDGTLQVRVSIDAPQEMTIVREEISRGRRRRSSG